MRNCGHKNSVCIRDPPPARNFAAISCRRVGQTSIVVPSRSLIRTLFAPRNAPRSGTSTFQPVKLCDIIMTRDNCAVICPSGPLRGSSLSAVLDTAGVKLSDTTVITGAPPSTAGIYYGKVIVIGLQNPPITVKEVQAACTHLKSGGQLVLVVPSSQVRHDLGLSLAHWAPPNRTQSNCWNI